MVGMARKKLNSAAVRRSTPRLSAPMIVAPERLTPGIIARHWAMPMPTAVLDRQLGDADDIGSLGQPLDDQDGDAADDQGDRNDLRVPEQRLDMLDQDEAEDRRRQEGDQDVADEAPRDRVAPEQPLEHRPEGPPVEDDDREDRAELDDDVERRPFLRHRSRAARWRGSDGRSRRPAGTR